jgi:predicted nucleotidyltransferase
MAIQLDADHLEAVRRIVRDHLPEAQVWCFGSRAVGKAWKWSDLDLAVEVPGGVPFTQLLRLKAAFSDSDLPIKVDVVDWDTLDPEFRNHIAAERQPL